MARHRAFRSPITAAAAALAATLLIAMPAATQEYTANPADVGTQDGIITAVYEAISGPAGQDRDWDRFRSLFAPGAHLIPVTVPAEGLARPMMWTVDDYIERAGESLKASGFFEVEISRTSEEYGHIAHMFSTYESRRAAQDVEPFARGINSFQLAWDGERWWVVNIFWDSEREGQPIPAKYGG